MEENVKLNSTPSDKPRRGKRFLFDLILVGGAITVALAAMLLILLNRRPGAVAVVEIDGVTVEEYSLSRDGEYPLNGGTNILVIKDGAAYIKEASCPDRTCVIRGKISFSGEDIICLPNRVRVYIKSSSDEIL